MARQRGGTPRRRHPFAGDRLLSVCNSLGLTSVPLASSNDRARPAGADQPAAARTASHAGASYATRTSVTVTGTPVANTAPSTAAQRRQTMVRARRVALSMKGRGKSLVKKARRITSDTKRQLVQKLTNLEQRYDLSRSAVAGAVTSTVMNVLCGSLILGATSLVVAGVSVALAERMRNRRWGRTRSTSTTTIRASYLGPSGRSFLVQEGGQRGASEYVHRRQRSG